MQILGHFAFMYLKVLEIRKALKLCTYYDLNKYGEREKIKAINQNESIN